MCLRRCVLVLCLPSLCFSTVISQDSISRDLPKGWETFKKDIFSLDDAQALPEAPSAPEGTPKIETVIKHVYWKVEDDGAAIRVIHEVRRLLEEASNEDFSTITESFRPHREKLHVVQARTILADGTSIPVEDSAIFVEPYPSSRDKVYTDRRQLRIVFPKTAPGTMTEWILIEESQPDIPEHWSASVFWQGIFPTRQLKVVLDLPASLGNQLVIDQQSLKLDFLREEVKPENRIRFQWQSESLSAIKFEGFMPSPRQRGPNLRIGLDGGWGKFGTWFSGLLQNTPEDAAAIATVAHEWAGGATDAREIAARLFERVSREIRYTSLSLGDGGYRPRSPAAVVDTAYGDCKDKANLLRYLLQHHGIQSRIALLQTTDPGEIPRKVVSLGVFNHAILAVDFADADAPVYCDPTLDGAPFGSLSGADSGRDLLLIAADGSHEWAKSPEAEPIEIVMSSNLDLEPSGGYAGWIDLKVGGVAGHLMARQFEVMETRSARLNEARSQFFRLIEGIRLIDDELVAGESHPFHYRYYVVQDPQTIERSAKTAKISLQCPSALITQVGPVGTRIHPFFHPTTRISATSSVQLPPGWEVLDHPRAWSASGSGHEMGAKWSFEKDGKLTGQINMERSQKEFNPRDFDEFADAIRELVNWFTSPVLVARLTNLSDAEGDDKTVWQADPETLPRMPSGEGFVALVNERYPFDPRNPFESDLAARRSAFERMRDLYSQDDHDSQFTARIMALLSEMLEYVGEDRARDIADEFRQIIAVHEPFVKEDQIAAAEMMVAIAMGEAGEIATAISLCEALLVRENLSTHIRQATAAFLTPLIAEAQPARAVTLAEEAMQSQFLPADEFGTIVSCLLDCAARLPDASPTLLADRMVKISATHSSMADELTRHYLAGPEQLVYYGHHREAKMFQAALESVADELVIADEALGEMADYFSKLDKVAPLQQRLLDYLAANPWPNLHKVEEGDVLENAIDGIDDYNDRISVTARYQLRGLTFYGPQIDFSERISDFIETLDEWREELIDGAEEESTMPSIADELIDLLLTLWIESPPGEFYANEVDALIARGNFLERTEGIPAATFHYQNLANDSARPDHERLRAIGRLATLAETNNDLEAYLAALRFKEDFVNEPDWRLPAVIDAAYLNLEVGNRSESWRLFNLAAEVIDDLESFPGSSQKRAKAFVANPNEATIWWDRTELWWPKWEILFDALDDSANLRGVWSEQRPWQGVTKSDLSKLSAKPYTSKQSLILKRQLARQMLFARWHSDGAEKSLMLLKLVRKTFPEHEAEVTAVIQAIEE